MVGSFRALDRTALRYAHGVAAGGRSVEVEGAAPHVLSDMRPCAQGSGQQWPPLQGYEGTLKARIPASFAMGREPRSLST